MTRTVLLVDDSRVMLMSLRQTLELGGYQVETAPDGVAALARITSGLRPDLIITDINMPNMDGLTLIQRARPILRFTPILVLTTESQAAKRDEARRWGATGWLVKPVAGQDLLRVLRQIVPEA